MAVDYLLSSAPTAALALAVVISRLSGNDKSPFLVLLVLALILIFLVIALIAVVVAGTQRARPWAPVIGALIPLSYAGVVIVLARLGWIDSLPLLGFR